MILLVPAKTIRVLVVLITSHPVCASAKSSLSTSAEYESSTEESEASRVKREISDGYSTPSSTSESSSVTSSSVSSSSNSLSSFSSGSSSETSTQLSTEYSTPEDTVEILTDETNSTPFGSSYSADFTSSSTSVITSTEEITTTPKPFIITLPKITVFLGAQASEGRHINTFAVAGVTLSKNYLQDMLQGFPGCNGEDKCYLLDDAAFVMAVNQKRLNYQVGYFLGYVDPPLMESLLENEVYSRVKYYDYQAVCDFAHLGEKNCTSPAGRLIPNVVRSLVEVFNPHFWLSVIKRAASVVVQITNVLLVFVQMLMNAFAMDPQIDYVNCIKSTYRYYATDKANFVYESVPHTEQTGSFSCSPICDRQWTAMSVPDTNLKLIKASPICACLEKEYDWKITPSIADDVSICQTAAHPRYRRKVS